MFKTPWFPANVDPVRSGRYEMLNESTGAIFPVYWTGTRWFHDGSPVRPLIRIWPWRGATEPVSIVGYPKPLEPWERELEALS